jgi:glycerate dehydrogenase
MNIVITDGHTLNPGDLSWKAFDALGQVTYYDRMAAGEVLGRCRHAHVIVANKTPITREVIFGASQLKLVAVTATGYNVVDVAAAKEKGVLVRNVPEYGTHSVAQHSVALLPELANNVGLHAASVRQGDWVRSADWCYARAPIIELKDKILGIVGLGRIGNQAARIAVALGMEVIYHRGEPKEVRARAAGLEDLFRQSDFISLHCPATPANHQFVNASLLSLMKPSAFLVNTSRGQLIDEAHLAKALEDGVLAGAALDVLSKEPPLADHPLLQVPRCLITPHNAWLSFEARQRIMNTTFQNVKAGLEGKPANVVG